MELTKIVVDDLAGLVLEDERYRLLVLPEVGAKMASLVDKQSGREVLWQNPARHYRRPAYGAAFDAYDYSGCDDCFPNIAAGPYPGQPWEGIRLPDHGELWTNRWQWEYSGGELHLWTHGVRLPYRFERWVARSGDGIRLRYRVTNPTQHDMTCLYAAHCLFSVRPGTRVLLPEGIHVRLDWSKGFRLGAVCDALPWPHAADRGGNPVDLSVIESDVPLWPRGPVPATLSNDYTLG